MQAFFYKCCLSVILFLITLCTFSAFSEKAYANPYGMMCYQSQYNGPQTVDQYCNVFTTSGFTDTNNDPKIEALRKMNIFAGYDSGVCALNGASYPCFLPQLHITRWQAAAAITRYHIFVKRDWYSWDPANDPVPNQAECDCFPPPVENFDGSYLADVEYYDPGGWETHTALLHNFIRGGTCDSFYGPVVPTQTWNDPNSKNGYTSGVMVLDPNHWDNTAGHYKWVRDKDLCFGPFNDWAFGFHGVDRAGNANLVWGSNPYNTPPRNYKLYYSNFYGPVSSCIYPGCEGLGEESWRGEWYKFVSGGDAPYYITRKDFADLLYDYYVEVDNNNYCVNPQTGTLSVTGTDTGTDGSGAYCVIHAGQTQCTASLSWNTNYTLNNTCNYAAVTKPGVYPPNTVGPDVEAGTGKTGSITSDATTGSSDVKTYKLIYNFDMTYPYISGKSFTSQLSTLNFSGRNTTGTITIPAPGTPCQIPSNGTTCSQGVAWDTSYITNGATVTFRDTTNNVLIGTGLSGSTNYSISGPTTFTLYENGIQIATRTITPTQLLEITGTINVDYNDNAATDDGTNGTPNDGDGRYGGGILITLVSQCGDPNQTTTSDGSGNYSFINLRPCGYTVSIPATTATATYPEGLHPSSVQTNPIGVALFLNSAAVNFAITPYYRISGGVFVDVNKNGKKDGGENYYTGGAITITNSAGGTVTYPGSGTFLITGLRANNQSVVVPTNSVSYTSTLPNGYVLTYPTGGAGSPTYATRVGRACLSPSVSPTGGDGTCDVNGNVISLNFGISNSTPWLQGIGMDMRFDGGLTNRVPSLTACGSGYTMIPSPAGDATSKGGVFIGNSSAASAFGVRSAPSANPGWVIDASYPELFKPVVGTTIRTSYDYLLGAVDRAGITKTDLATINTCTDPSVSCSLPSLASGVYTYTGNVILSSLAIAANRNVIILIKGNLSITDTITTPNTSTLQIAVGDNAGGTGGDITIASSIGTAGACPAPAGQIQGFFTADKNIIVNGTNDCTIGKDSMLTLEGAFIVNAKHSGGSFTYNRDLCEDDTSYPTVVIRERPDFILHAPEVSKQQNYLFQEVAP